MTDPSSLAAIAPLVALVANDEAGSPAAPALHEWQRLAHRMGADDLGTDLPGAADDDAAAWYDWAERTHGAAARSFIATYDALGEIRFGPIPAAVNAADHAAEVARLKAQLAAPLPQRTEPTPNAVYRIHPSQIDQVRTLLEELEHGTLDPEVGFTVTVSAPAEFTHYCITCDEYVGPGHDGETAGTHDVDRVL